MTEEIIPKWIRVVTVIVAVLAGFNILSSVAGSGYLFAVVKVNPDVDVIQVGSLSMLVGIIAGLVGAVICPLFVRRILKEKRKKTYIITMIVLAVVALLPLPQPYFYVIF